MQLKYYLRTNRRESVDSYLEKLLNRDSSCVKCPCSYVFWVLSRRVERAKDFIGMTQDLHLIMVGVGAKKKRCHPRPLEAGPSNWMDRMENGDDDVSDESFVDMDLDHIEDQDMNHMD
ncbi:hypothetical protein LIER_31293 [Lithospermum erythrorhizon]|uniref:Uncharacterized protein n=1 Tax=Lithospermum erythrorhizon TaxID=34254 RepID=A0AAV3RUB0_LITER